MFFWGCRVPHPTPKKTSESGDWMLLEEDLHQQLPNLLCQLQVKQFILTCSHLHVLFPFRVFLGLSLDIQQCCLSHGSYLWYSNTWLPRLTSGISSSHKSLAYAAVVKIVGILFSQINKTWMLLWTTGFHQQLSTGCSFQLSKVTFEHWNVVSNQDSLRSCAWLYLVISTFWKEVTTLVHPCWNFPWGLWHDGHWH